jgi:hypothetical protein
MRFASTTGSFCWIIWTPLREDEVFLATVTNDDRVLPEPQYQP